MSGNKESVYKFWNESSCGERLYINGFDKEAYLKQSELRYRLEPYIIDFADAKRYKDKKVLEIGVGLGADHQLFGKAGAVLYGIDLTDRAIEHTKIRFEYMGLKTTLQVSDAENLPFEDHYFDLVYSWGVLQHTPDTPKAIKEVYRVLKRGGIAKIMIYNKYSFVGYMLWLRYALLKLKPFTSLDKIYFEHLESLGTKAYTIEETREMFKQFPDVCIDTVLTHGDLLTSAAGQRHEGPLLSVARKIWPRWFIKRFFPKHGLFMMISAKKNI